MATKFISTDFMLQSTAANELYHQFAKDEPILDFHNHLSPEDIANDRTFSDLYEIWLAGDHYKWRAMRANGIAEQRISGEAEPRDKFDAWAETVPHTLRNALYHWTHLELDRYFGFEQLLSPSTADQVWNLGNDALAKPEFSCRSLLQRMNVRALCTTDDPIHSLEHHRTIAEDDSIDIGIYPTFRPDWMLKVGQAQAFTNYVNQLSDVSGIDCANLSGYLDAVRSRHDFFHDLGGRLSDHDLYTPFAIECSTERASQIYEKAISGKDAEQDEINQFGNYMMLYFAELDTYRGWTKQLHMGCERNNNSHIMTAKGHDMGCDSMGDHNQAKNLRFYLDQLNSRGHLPKMIVYNLNPKDNYSLAGMIGNFQTGKAGEPPCRLQLGTAWWFLDTKEGMEWQINAFSNNSLLSRFLGMLTDSRSFLSFTRHEYFRRILCNVIGQDMENGEIPRDMELVGDMVKRICYQNAADFFGLDIPNPNKRS